MKWKAVNPSGSGRGLSCLFVFLVIGFSTVDVFRGFMETRLGIQPRWSNLADVILFGLAAGVLVLLLKSLGSAPMTMLAAAAPPRSEAKDDVGDPLLAFRFFAFFCVFVTHALITLRLDADTARCFVTDHTYGYLIQGCAHSGMAVFFTLSGYLMGKAFYTARYGADRTGILAFYRNRALRIMPLYYIASFLITVLIYPQFLRPENIGQLWRPLTFNYYGSTIGPISALWSLTTEMHYYLIAPFIFLALSPLLTSTMRSVGAIVVMVALGAVYRCGGAWAGTDWYLHRFTPLISNLDIFLTGFLLNSLIQRHKSEWTAKLAPCRQWLPWIAVATCGLIYAGCAFCEHRPVVGEWFGVVFTYFGFRGRTGVPGILPNIASLLSAVVILSLELYKAGAGAAPARTRGATILHIISCRLQFLGLITYSLYVWHSPIMESLGKAFEIASVPWYAARCLLVFLIVALAGTGSYFLIEKPFERLKRFEKAGAHHAR